MSTWTYSILENYCTYSMRTKKNIKCVNEKGETSIFKNKNYIAIRNRPKWCIRHNHKMVPCLRCMDDEKIGRCNFFTYCEADKKECQSPRPKNARHF